MKFKVGDKVRRIGFSNEHMEIGETDIVVGISEKTNSLNLQNHKIPYGYKYFFNADFFEKVEENQDIIEYKGNKYDVIGIHYRNNFNNGMIDLSLKYHGEETLNSKEKEYISAIIKPFKNNVKNICKTNWGINEMIIINYNDYVSGLKLIMLPSFKENSMYKNMEIDKYYTLKELGL